MMVITWVVLSIWLEVAAGLGCTAIGQHDVMVSSGRVRLHRASPLSERVSSLQQDLSTLQVRTQRDEHVQSLSLDRFEPSPQNLTWRGSLVPARQKKGEMISAVLDQRHRARSKCSVLKASAEEGSRLSLSSVSHLVTQGHYLSERMQTTRRTKTDLTRMMTRKKVVFNQPSHDPSLSSLDGSLPCPSWTPAPHYTVCSAGTLTSSIEVGSSGCDESVPPPAAMRQADENFDADAPSVEMFCTDKGGAYLPPEDAYCSLPRFNRSEQCRNCLSSYYGDVCTPCKSCGDQGVCNEGVGGNGTCLCESGWIGEMCDCLDGSHMVACASTPSIWELRPKYPTKLVMTDGSTFDYLGQGGPSLSADGLVLAVAAHLDDEQGVDSGSILVWTRSNTSVSFGGGGGEATKLVDPDGQAYDELGRGGATLAGNGLVLAAGAHQDDDKGDMSGSILVWMRSESDVGVVGSFDSSPPFKLNDPNGTAQNQLGRGGVALSFDGLVLAGASHVDSEGGTNSGSILVWMRSNSSVYFNETTPVKLFMPEGEADDALGYGGPALSADGLVLAAAAHLKNIDGKVVSGCVVVWERTDAAVPFSAALPVTLADPDGSSNDHLGEGGVCLSADGLVLAAGSPQDSENGPNSGSVIVWQRLHRSKYFNTSTPIKLTDPNGAAQDFLGYGRLSLSGDGLVLAATSYRDDERGRESGSILVWERRSFSTPLASVTPVKLTDPGSRMDDLMGEGGVSLSFNGRVLASASRMDDDMGFNSGSVLVWDTMCEGGFEGPYCVSCRQGYVGPSCERCPDCGGHGTCAYSGGKPTCVCDGEWDGPYCGIPAELSPTLHTVEDPDVSTYSSLSNGGVTLSADGLILAAGAPDDDDRGVRSGAVYIWERSNVSAPFNTTNDPPTKLTDPSGQVGDRLGYGGVAVSLSGLILVAASHLDDDMGTDSGSVLVWQRTSLQQGWGEVIPIKLLNPTGGTNGVVGAGGVAIAADGLVISATSHLDSGSGGSESGTILIWERSNLTSPLAEGTVSKIDDPNGVAGDHLGRGGVALSSDGLVLAAASPWSDSAHLDGGAVLVWGRQNLSIVFTSSSALKLHDPTGGPYHRLGYGGVAMSADGLVLASAAHLDDVQGGESGSVVVWSRQNTSSAFGSTSPIKLSDDGGSPGDRLGESGVTLSSDGLVLTTTTTTYSNIIAEGGAVLVWYRRNNTELFDSARMAHLVQDEPGVCDMLGHGRASVSRWGSSGEGSGGEGGTTVAAGIPGSDACGQQREEVVLWDLWLPGV